LPAPGPEFVALDRDVAQALDIDAEHRQGRGDPLGPEERAMPDMEGIR
jgi:hypothetical protein